MLLSQFKPSWSSSISINPKVSVAGVEIGASAQSQMPTKDLASKVHTLTQKLKREKSIESVQRDSQFDSDKFWLHSGEWHNGLYVFGADDGDVVAYFLWTTVDDILVLLVGSPTNVVGEKIANSGANLYGTHSTWLAVLRFLDRTVGSSKDILVSAKETKKATADSETLQSIELQLHPDVRIQLMTELVYGRQITSRSIALGVFCLKYLSWLPRNRVETIFKIIYQDDIEDPQELLESKFGNWDPATENALSDLKRYKRLIVGSPLYSALL